MHFGLNDAGIIKGARFKTNDGIVIRVFMIDTIAAVRAKITSGPVATVCHAVKVGEFTAQQFKVFPLDEHRQA